MSSFTSSSPTDINDYAVQMFKAAGSYFDDDLSSQSIPKDILSKVPNEIASKYHLFPLAENDSQLICVTDSEQTFKSRMIIQEQIHMPIKLLAADTENVRMALSKFYDIQAVKHNYVYVDNADLTPLRLKAMGMIQDAAKSHASDIHMLPYAGGFYVHFRINGHLFDVSTKYIFDPEEIINITNIIKQMDTSDTADASRTTMPDGGSFEIRCGDLPVFIRFATVPIGNDSNGFQKINLRLLPQNHKIVKLDEIGYQNDDLKIIKKVLLKSATGLFLNSGPTGSGKTTSLYAQMYYVRDVLNEPLNIITIDDPIEIKEETFTQVQVHEADIESANLTPDKIVKVGLRSDPDIFLYNEIRDSKAAFVALTASMTGHRTFSTVHASDCVRTIFRLLDLDVSKVTLLSELKMIISQRLVGVLCSHCSKPHVLTDEEKSILSVRELAELTAPGVDLREPGSEKDQNECPYCNHGLEGRTAVAEYIIMNDTLRDALLNKQTFGELTALLKQGGFKTMWEKGLSMVKSGRVELKEIIHVIGKDTDD